MTTATPDTVDVLVGVQEGGAVDVHRLRHPTPVSAREQSR